MNIPPKIMKHRLKPVSENQTDVTPASSPATPPNPMPVDETAKSTASIGPVDTKHVKLHNLNLKPVKGAPKQGVVLKATPKAYPIQKTPESLPVLEAFQEFLDSERKKMRKKMIGLSIFFTLMIIIISGVALLTGYMLLNPMKKNVSEMQAALDQIEASSASSQKNTELTISSFREILEKEKKVLTDTKADLETQVGSYDDGMEKMKEMVTTLQNENTDLKKDMGLIQSDLPSLSANLSAIMKELANIRSHTSQNENKVPLPPTTTKKISGSSPSGNIILSFIPKGQAERVNCLLPIPE